MKIAELKQFIAHLKKEQERGSRVVDQEMVDHFEFHLQKLEDMQSEIANSELFNICLN